MLKKTPKVVEPTPVKEQAAVQAVPSFSFSLRYLRKKDGSMSLQECINGSWIDVPMELEQ